MNILITTYQGGMAGSTQSIYYLAKGLAEKGHQVYLGCRKGKWLQELAKDSSIQLVTMEMTGKFKLKSIKEHRAVIEQYDIELVNAQSSIDRYLPIFSKWLYGGNFKVVHTRRQKPASMGGWLQNFIYNKGADQFIAVSSGVESSLVELGLKPDKITVIHNGLDQNKLKAIDLNRQKELRKKYNIQENDIVLGCISRLKKQDQIVRALHQLSRPCVLILVGLKEGDITVDTAFKLPHRIIYTGQIDNTTALNHYKLFDIKILASTTEGLSQSLLEAMALGVPVIATDAAGNPDLIQHEMNGLLFKDEEISMLAHQIERVIEEDKLRESLIKNGQKTALVDFSIQRTVDKHEALFQQLLAQ